MTLSLAIIIVLILVVILVIALLAKRMPIWGSKNLTYYQKCARDTFDQLKGDAWADKNQEAIDYMASVKDDNKNAYDYFMKGATYMYGRREPDRIADNYRLALNEVARGNVHEDERDFIVGRIRDHVFFHPEPFAETKLADLHEPVMDIYNMMLNDELAEAINASKPKVATRDAGKPPPKTVAERVERKAPEMRSDSQNVHDAAVTLEFSKQYQKLRIYNDDDARNKQRGPLNDAKEEDRAVIKSSLLDIDGGLEKKLNDKAMTAFMKWMKEKITDKSKFDDLNRRFVNTYDMLDRNGNGKILERDVIAQVWRRINSNQNEAKRDDMLEALEMQLLGCFENGKPVCVTGRSEQIFSSLAKLDQDKELGVLMTSELIKGQMYSEGSKIIDAEVMKLPVKIRTAYNASKAKEQLDATEMKQLEEAVSIIHNRLDAELGSKYSAKLPHADATLTINTIKNTVKVD